MSKINLNKYEPSRVFPPGATILEWISFKGMTQREMAERMGMHKENLNEIITGKSCITEDAAIKIENAVGMKADYIMKLEKNYRLHLARLRELDNLRKEQRIFKEFPIREIVKRGWISKGANDLENFKKLKEFLGVSNLSDARKVYSELSPSFRRSSKYSFDELSAICWFRRAENIINERQPKKYNRDNLVNAIPEIKKSMSKKLESEYPKIVKILEYCGIYLVVEKPLSRTPVFGAVKKYTNGRVLLLMTLRYNRADIFWFTLFHELYHVLSLKKRESFIVDYEGDSDEEKLADNYAAEEILNRKDYDSFVSKCDFRRERIIDFAQRKGVIPGIVVGRLRRDGNIRESNHSDLIDRISYETLIARDGRGQERWGRCMTS